MNDVADQFHDFKDNLLPLYGPVSQLWRDRLKNPKTNLESCYWKSKHSERTGFSHHVYKTIFQISGVGVLDLMREEIKSIQSEAHDVLSGVLLALAPSAGEKGFSTA